MFNYTITDGDGDTSPSTLTINVANATVLAPTDSDVTVNENALDTTITGSDLAAGTITGSLGTASPAETDASNQLDGSGGFGTLTYALVSGGNAATAGTFGTIQVHADGSYVYTLTSPVTEPTANNGADTVNAAESFTYVVTDAVGNSATGTININIVDDVPTATADVNSAGSGQTVTGNVETNDTAGADGIASIAWAGAVGSTVTGAHGTLTVGTDGSYSYHANPNTSGTDVFNYTITDGDGDTSPSTLTINVANATVLAPTDSDVTVNENALDTTITGSDLAAGTITGSLGTASPAETDASNQLDGSGGFGTLTYALVSGGNAATAGTFGTIQVHADGSYVYTLTSPVTEPTANNGADTVNAAESFTYMVTDAVGNSATGTININIVDDVPTATADVNSAGSGQTVTGNVETNDTAGADGIASIAWAGAVGSTVTGAHGTLTVGTDGSYSYHANPNTSGTDVFNYTITDGDGDTSPSTLTINVANATVLAPTDSDVTVNENALDTTITGSDLAAGTITGSLGTASPAETDASNQLDGSGGFGTLTYALVSGGNAATAGTFGTIQVHADGSYVYTLTSPVTEPTANNGADTVNAAESFTYMVTDAVGNSATGTININIVDDVPTATADVNSAGSGQTVTGNVETNDTAGADGIASIAWAGAVGSTVTGAHGTLTVGTDGSYSYHANPNTSGTDVFNYTITDGDGDTSPSTLTINVANATVLAPTDSDVTVNENALDTTITGSDLAAGTITGSLGTASPAETDASNQLDGSGGFGTLTYALVSGGNAATAGTFGTIQVHADGSYVYTLTSPVTEPTANNGADTVNAAESFTYMVTDAVGNSATGTININIVDDVPTATADVNSAGSGQTVTGNVETNDTAGADGIASIAWAGAVGSTVTGAHGTLTVGTDGSYSYHANPNTSGTDVFNYTITDGDGDTSPSTLTINVANATVLAPTDSDVTVNENALDTTITGSDLAAGTITGSLGTASPAETDASNQLDGSGGFGTLTYALVSGGNAATAGTFGTIQVHADGSYVYTLTSPVTEPTANNGADTVNAAESFTYMVTDAVGNSATGTININIVDDVPTATADVNSAGSGQTVTGNVETNDTAGADGIASIAWAGAVGSTVTGAHGTLTVGTDGSYSYHANPNTSGTDVFNYTITDGDGDTSPSTLTINVANATVLAPTDSDVTVNENALDTTITGSDLAAGTITGSLGTASPAETDASNQLDGSGGFGTLTYALVSGGNAATAGTFGTIQVHADGSYVYTLTSPVTEPTANNGADTVNAAESFTYMVTDAVGNSATGTININIVDDVPTATADVNSAGSGQTVTGNVETNDTAGADGIASIAWAGAVGSTVTGAHGTLTVGTDGSYSYHANPNTSGTDVFNYTITDGDGDTSPSTLTINVANATVLAPTDSDVTVNENALDTTITGSDLAAGTITGSLGTASPAETDASNQLDGSGGFGTLTYALVSGGNAATAGTFGTIQVHADGSYVYTLTSPVTEPTANNGADTVNAAESFTYMVTDAVGNSATGTININIVDDVPTATADVNSAGSGQTVTGNVETNDTAGADGIASIAWAGAVGSTVTGAHGTLTVGTDGSYSYHANPNTSGTDVFNYTITDGDGDTSPSTLTINVANATVLAPTDSDVTVNENALDTTITGSDLAAGTITGSLGTASPAETDASNQLDGSGGFGTLTYALVSGGNAATAGTFGTIQVHADGSYVYTLTSPVTEPTANNGADTVNAAESFTYMVTDAVGNSATGTININIVDDVPTAPTVTASAATAGVDETPGVQTTGGANDVLGSSAITFNGAANTVAGLFSAVVNKGTDPDVPVASLDNGALSFASSGAVALVTVTVRSTMAPTALRQRREVRADGD